MLGILIINYNQWQKTVDCINSVFKTVKSPYKIYLLDNASANDSAQELERIYKNNKRVVFIKNKQNTGYANGNNLLINLAEKDGCNKILISNNDIIFDNNAIDKLYNDICENDCLAIAPRLKYPNGTIQQNIKKEAPNFKKYILSETYFHNFDKKRKYQNNYVAKKFEYVYWISGAVFIADTSKFKSIGYFDKNTFLYFEEYILAEKAAKSNLKIATDPLATAYHFHGASTGGNANLFTRTENLKSELYFFKNYKNFSKSKLNLLKNIRCLEVLFTFTKEHQFKNALMFIKSSKKILRNT